MPLILLPYAARAETPFPECTALAAVAERADVIALAWVDDRIADSGRAVYAGHHRNGVGVYDARTRALLARFHSQHEVNVLAFHPTRDELAIATGSYDGGYAYEGQLLLWNWRTGSWHSELTEDREVSRVEWRGDELLATVSPATDEDPPGDLTFLLAPARAGQVAGRSVEWASDSRLEASRGRPVASPVPDEPYERYRKLLARHARVTALEWLADGRVAIGTSDRALLLWEPATQRTQEFRVESQVVAMWRHPDHELLLQIDAHQTSTSLFAIAGDGFRLVKAFRTLHTCSLDRHGRILARSVVSERRRKSTVLNAGRKLELALGRFDVFNHCLRLDGGDELYFLQGTPATAYDHKKLCAITASGEAEVRMPWDADEHHLMNSIGTLVGDGRLARGFLLHEATGTKRGGIELCDLTGRAFWRHDIEGGIAAMAIWQGCVVAGLVDGRFLGLELETGKVLHDEPFVFGSSAAMITAIAVHDEAIALGSIDGRVAIVASR